mmetsp:Transcript_160646/g.296128  ORF Transcript_160646/g.296128 Transcript_160646/m.296128 type:complete len:260 (-) Transcript_160646:148-927(-)
MAAMIASPAAVSSFGTCRSPGRLALGVAGSRLVDEEACADYQARMAQWRKDTVNSANQEAQHGLRELVHERERLDDLRNDLSSIASELQEEQKLQEQREASRSINEAAAARAEVVLKAKQEVIEGNRSLAEELQQEERALFELRTDTDAQYAEAERLLGMYRDRLGLSITRAAPRTVRFAFTRLDEADPAKEFAFTLGIADHQKTTQSYAVHGCSPQVPELPMLLAKLNRQCRESRWGLPRFVCSMRRAFQKLALDHED